MICNGWILVYALPSCAWTMMQEGVGEGGQRRILKIKSIESKKGGECVCLRARSCRHRRISSGDQE